VFNPSATPIQTAVDSASSDETICVAAGSYSENVDIATAHLTLEGEGAGVVTVTAANPYDHVFEVTADYVNISGFTATGATDSQYTGIYLNGADYCNISENTASNNGGGIFLYESISNTLTSNTASNNDYGGIGLYSSSDNTLTSNTASNNGIGGIGLGYSSGNTLTSNTASGNNGRGIGLYSSSGNTLTSNTANSNNGIGIYLHDSRSNTLTSNTASNNGGGIYLYESRGNTLTSNTASNNNNYGIHLYRCYDNTLTSNIASDNGVKGIRLDRSSSNALTSNTASGNNYGICLDDSSNYNTLTSNTASGNNYGICLDESSSNTLTSNTASGNNNYGIYLDVSNSNTLTSNTASNNNNYGIYLECGSSNNLINNNYLSNANNAYDNGNNQWNTEKTSGTNIIGGSYLGGNYWSDYAGVDNDGDGLGNTMLPYNSSGDIHNGGDYHPLVVASSDTTPPVITITTPTPYGLYTVGMTLDFSATDSESGVATIAGNLTNTIGVSQIVDSGFAPAVGVYTLVVTATDDAGNTNEGDPVFFVVYDPDGGHATGGGWFYPDSDSTLPGGKANFGFTARYKNDVSTGKLNFQYKDADIHLKSTSIDWLTISSVSAQFQGTGTINGEGLYTFRVQAKDNGEPGAGSDHFDIKIWEGTDTEADPYHKAKNVLSGGNIQVHKKG
jgi:parallel beta-helix repeat protein